MSTLRLSATSARNKFFELLNQVALGNQVIIERDNKEVAILSPKTTKVDWKALREALKEAKGILSEYSPEEIAPAKAGSAWGNFGNWDKDNKLETK
jgi:prevent-host-death family protein